MMDGGRYPLAMAVLQSTSRAVFVGGAALGGLVVALFGARPALAADALTFVASGLLILFGTRARPAAAPAGDSGAESPLAQLAAALRLVFGDPGAPHADRPGLAGRVLRGSRGAGGALRGEPRGRGGRGRPADRLLAARRGGGDADLHQEDRPAHPAQVDGPDGGAHLRYPRGDDPASGPRSLDGDLRPVQHVRDVSDRREHRVRRADTERAPRSGLRPRQRGSDRGSGGGFRYSWSGRRGGTSLDGRSSQWGTRCPYRLWSSAPVAANVACRRASHCETSWPRGIAYQADTCPCGSF